MKIVNYKKLILVGCISAFVAVLTSILGVAGTVIGSVISSVLYNMLSEALEKPVEMATFSHKFEWEIAYIFPLVVIAIIQLLLIFALLSEFGILPHQFLTAFLSLQHLTDNNLYRILGIAMLIISIYPFVLKPDIIKRSHGFIIAFVGLIFLARGFVDAGTRITNMYDVLFMYFDFPIALIAFILIIFVIYKIALSARESENEFRTFKHQINQDNFSHDTVKKVHHSNRHDDFDYREVRESIRTKHNTINHSKPESDVRFKNHIAAQKQKAEINEPVVNVAVDEMPNNGINKSSANIQFESNDILDDYKK